MSSEWPARIYSAAVDWTRVRAYYRQLMTERRVTQQLVARRGHLRQKDVSLLLSNARKGPTTETFLRAVEGLGMSVADFFVGFARDQLTAGGGTPTIAPPDQEPGAEHGAAVSATPRDVVETIIAANQTLARTVDRLVARLEQAPTTRPRASGRRRGRAGRARKVG